MSAASEWAPVVDGFESGVGTEGGLVRVDEEHPAGARITLEEAGTVAPWAITCGVYGRMMHTTYFQSETDARSAFAQVKIRLSAILDAKDEAIDALVDELTRDFPT